MAASGVGMAASGVGSVHITTAMCHPFIITIKKCCLLNSTSYSFSLSNLLSQKCDIMHMSCDIMHLSCDMHNDLLL